MEIKKELRLSLEEKNYVEMHSVLNLLNILTYEILQLSDLLQDEEILMPSLSFIQDMAHSLSNRDKTIKLLADIGSKKEDIEANLLKVEAGESLTNIRTLLDIFEVRAAEIILREKRSTSWAEHRIEDLKRNFDEVFRAMEGNSKGRYRIVTDDTQHGGDSYLIRWGVQSGDEETVYMPMEMQDLMRDLIANARKYSEPGSRIEALLRQTDSELEFVVEDEGKGIPEDQIESIVDYGYRGENVRSKKSYGGGFGLTKAYYVTTYYGGRMWIDSTPGEGTKITVRIPLP